MNLITTLVIAIATSLTGVSAVSSLRGVADTFEDQVAVALGGHRKQDCVDNCQYWRGVSKQSCKDCCKQGGNTCDPETLGGMCGVECRVDGDCRNGGLIMCGTCNTVGGTRYVNTCIADNETPEPPPSPWDRCATDNVGRSAGLDRPERAKRRQSAAPTTSDHSNTSASTSANLVPLLPQRQRLGYIPEVKEVNAPRNVKKTKTALREDSSCAAYATRYTELRATKLVSIHPHRSRSRDSSVVSVY